MLFFVSATFAKIYENTRLRGQPVAVASHVVRNIYSKMCDDGMLILYCSFIGLSDSVTMFQPTLRPFLSSQSTQANSYNV
jgi:hypothetical protein